MRKELVVYIPSYEAGAKSVDVSMRLTEEGYLLIDHEGHRFMLNPSEVPDAVRELEIARKVYEDK